MTNSNISLNPALGTRSLLATHGGRMSMNLKSKSTRREVMTAGGYRRNGRCGGSCGRHDGEENPGQLAALIRRYSAEVDVYRPS
jgi:hypothetical protein